MPSAVGQLIDQNFNNAVSVALTGEKTPEQALADAQSAALRAWDQSKAGKKVPGWRERGAPQDTVYTNLNPVCVESPPPQRRRRRQREKYSRRETIAGLLFISLDRGASLSSRSSRWSGACVYRLSNYDLATNRGTPVGLANYQLLLEDPRY